MPDAEPLLIGPGAPLTHADMADGGVTGMGSWPSPYKIIKTAAGYLDYLDGAQVKVDPGSHPHGATFLAGDFPAELGRLADQLDKEMADLRNRLRDAEAPHPMVVRARSIAFDRLTWAYNLAGRFRSWYRTRHGDDRWDDM